MGYLLLYLCLHLLCIGRAQEDETHSDITDNNISRDGSSQNAHQENRKPMFDKCREYSPLVPEEEPDNTFVIKVTAVDPDDPEKPGGKVTYNIENPAGTRSNFHIDEKTGQVFTSTHFDRDEPIRQKELYLTVRAVDDGQPQLADICTFKVTVTDVNDNAPIFDQQDYKALVSEDHRENTEVLRVFAYDYDDGENARLTYSLSSSGSNENSNNNLDDYFRIDENTGVIYLTRALTGKLKNKFSGLVRVHDNGQIPKDATAEVSFTVVDSGKKAPSISVDFKEIALDENESDFDKHLITFHAESNIDDKSVAFELVKGKTTQTNKDQTFILSPDNTKATIKLARFLDYETVTEYQLTVRVQNKDSLSASENVVIKVNDVNDEIPTFIELLKGSVVENDSPGAQAMTVRAIDKDGTAPNNEVRYELQSYTDLFEINPETGLITAKVAFDREKEKIYHVTVQAHDSAPSSLFRDKKTPNSANQTFQISIEDQNDNPPRFVKKLYLANNISESADVGKDVIEVHAVDEDTASPIKYSIIEGNLNESFYIEESTGRIKVKTKLDFEQIEEYNLTVRASDGIYHDDATVKIEILNENDERPVFEPYSKVVQCKEESIPPNCIITLTAYDPDIKDKTADQKIVYSVGDTWKHFVSVDESGCVRLKAKLDRDPPKGSSTYQAYIIASDNNKQGNSLEQFAELNINLTDINDNAPILELTEYVWYENEEPGRIVTLTAIDYDTPENGPPFTYEIADSTGEISDKFEIQGSDLYAKVTFDREEKKYYHVPIKITDSGKDPDTGASDPRSGVSILRVIIGDKNDNAAQNGSSEIFVYQYKDFKMDSTEVGRVYVNDPDDWDLPDKVFQTIGNMDNFELHNSGMIAIKRDTVPGVYKLDFKVTEKLPNGTTHDVYADVTITVKEIPEEAVRKSGSIRLSGATIEEFVEKNEAHLSKKDILQNYISKILNTSLDNVDVFTVMTSPSNSSFVDVRFSAHGSPYYAPEKLNNKATEKQAELEQQLGVRFEMISINECMNENSCPANSSCSNNLSIKDEPAVVFTNKTSFVGIKAVAEALCECRTQLTRECLNGGTPVEDKCSCPEGAEGPNCEILGVTFLGDGWAMYPTFNSCSSNVISLSILPQADDGLIFYAGPLSHSHTALSKDFISLELRDGYVVLKIEKGHGAEEFESDYKKINDGAIHKIKINYTSTDVQIEVDECPSDCLKWKALNFSGLLRINGPLQIGGRSNIFSEELSKTVWPNPPSSKGFKGCITNFTYNSYLYNLGGPSDKNNAHGGTCNYGTFQAATFGIDSNFLVAILVCLAILLILLLAVVVHRRKQDNFNEKDMDDTTENIINYEDEGGGECDTNFDLSVLRNPEEKPPMKDNLYKHVPDVPADIGSFLNDKKHGCDKDTMPYDDVRYYAYEGDGNSSGSLSSLASCTDEGDLKFNYLSNFGPRFRKLADMYGDDASEEGSQNGEESWC